MESLLFLLTLVAMVTLVTMGLRDDRRRPGTPAKSYFRYIEHDPEASSHAETQPGQVSQAGKPVRGSRP